MSDHIFDLPCTVAYSILGMPYVRLEDHKLTEVPSDCLMMLCSIHTLKSEI